MMHCLLIFCLLCSCCFSIKAQTFETPVEYMSYLGDREESLSQKYLSYMSESAHGNRARKLEKRRQDLIAEIRQALADATRLRPYKGDATLRDAYKAYWDILLKVFNEDYHKIVNMEEIAEQSYDNMEAYLLAQEKAGEVLDNAHDKIEPIMRTFAANNNIKLIETDTRMAKQLRKVGAVNSYYHQLYLIFFKSLKQEMYATDAFNRKDINGLEQNRVTLLRFAEEGLSRLDTLKPYNGDGSVITACRKVLEFHKSEATRDIPVQAEYLVKASEFEKTRKAMEAKPASKRTQADIDAYNKAVNEMNQVLATSNKSLVALNAAREKVLNNWNLTVRKFMESHVPRAK